MASLERAVEEMRGELIALRRDLHRHPEPGFEEYYTSEKVADYLKSCGYEITAGIGGTGVIGVRYGSHAGPTFVLRACLDALEIPEETGVDYASENPGRMHACGHDGNMAVVLGAAKILARYKNVLNGERPGFCGVLDGRTGARFRLRSDRCGLSSHYRVRGVLRLSGACPGALPVAGQPRPERAGRRDSQSEIPVHGGVPADRCTGAVRDRAELFEDGVLSRRCAGVRRRGP